MAPHSITREAGLAIVPTDDGALLVTGSAGGLIATPLGARGEQMAPASTVWRPPGRAVIVEVDAAASGRLVGVVWLAEDGGRTRVYSAFSNDGGRTFSREAELGDSVTGSARGRLAMAANEDGALRAYVRVADGPCVGAERGASCAHFVGRAVGSDMSSDERGVERREIARPCDPLFTGLRWHDGTRYLAICSREPAQAPSPRTTVFVIRNEIDWAAVTELPCAPAGIAPLDRGVLVTIRCEDGRTSSHVLDAMGAEIARLDAPERAAACARGRVELRAGPHRLRLGEAADHLETLLPESIARPGARAIWTGEALLVALHAGGDAHVHRYACAGDRFERTDRR